MKNFSLITENPVPSCIVYKILWFEESKTWKYEYKVTIPDHVIIDKDGKFSEELFIYGHMQQLYLVDKVTKNSVNIRVNTSQEMVDVLNMQYEEDMKYRRNWIKDNPDYYKEVHQITLKNETQKSEYNHLIFIKEQLEDETIFVAAPQKGMK